MFDSDRQIANTFAGCVIHRAGDRGSGSDITEFTEPLDAGGVNERIHLRHQNHLDLRDISVYRHQILCDIRIDIAGVTRVDLGVLVQRRARV
jgi:hypothetical protein